MLINKNKINFDDKEKLKNSIEQSLVYNEDAIDYIVNRKKIVEDQLKYNSEDVVLQEELKILKYINLTLEHVGSMFETNLKRL